MRSANTWRMATLSLVLAAAPALLLTATVIGQTGDGWEQSKDHPQQSLFIFSSCATTHQIGKLVLTVSNWGTLGSHFVHNRRWTVDCFTGEVVPGCEFPKGSGALYLFGGALWIGGIVGKDTLVSTGSDGWDTNPKYGIEYMQHSLEYHADAPPIGNLELRSIMDPTSPRYEGAVSEEDIIAVYTDTFTRGVPGLSYDRLSNRPHKPLNIEVTQRSYAWSYPYAENFILLDYHIKNIGTEHIQDAYMGIFLDPDVCGADNRSRGIHDDICGFLPHITMDYGTCEFEDTVNIAWSADNEGDFTKNIPVTGVIGLRFLQTTSGRENGLSFNWWTSNSKPALDFGPRRRNSPDHPFRDFHTGGLGTPEGDRNKYAVMRNGEIDYDVIYTGSITAIDPIWLYPTQLLAQYLTRGYDIYNLHSLGPFDLSPNQVFRVSLAFVAGEDFHTDPMNYRHHLQMGSYFPDDFMESLNFMDLAENARWASWVFDNPGVDSDGDGYFGKFRLCCRDSAIVSIDTNGSDVDTTWEHGICDTMWYEGDGRPDFRGATPPPAPRMRVKPSVGRLLIRWNGFRSETTPDVFTQLIDFDGYRVYLSRDAREESFVLLASYDRDNYLKYVYDSERGEFQVKDYPLSREVLTCLYGDSCNDPYFDPLSHTRSNPLVYGDSAFYFAPQDFNRSEPGVTTPILKSYPDAPCPFYTSPEGVPDSLRDVYLTEDGQFKYYEYEYTIDNLLPTVSYYVNVTSFDYGSPQSGLSALETARSVGAQLVYPLAGPEEVAEGNLGVYVYPNPYRLDGHYLDMGYEGRGARYYIPDRLRRIHFANLPPKCHISILTLDGDLVRRLDHDRDPSDPTASHDTWDLITRNTQAVVSGIYYWVVEAEGGETQIGKLVIIK